MNILYNIWYEKRSDSYGAATNGGKVRVMVTVKPGARKGPLVEAAGDGVVVHLREKPHDGEANVALVRLLAEHYGVAKSCVVIVGGAKSRKKLVEILGKV